MDVMIEIYGTPKEIVVGEITEEQYEFWKEREQGYGDSPSLTDYCLRKNDYEIDEEYEIDEKYDFIIDDWTDVNDVYSSVGFIGENSSTLRIKVTISDNQSEIGQHEATQIRADQFAETSIELDEPNVGEFHFISMESYEKQLCFKSKIENVDFDLFKENPPTNFLSFKKDIIYDKEIIVDVFYKGIPFINQIKNFSSLVTSHQFSLKP